MDREHSRVHGFRSTHRAESNESNNKVLNLGSILSRMYTTTSHGSEQLHEFQDGTLKWKSQDMTNANTMQASKKLRNRRPCQKFRVWTAAESLVPFHDSVGSDSATPTTFCARDPHISQVLYITQHTENSCHFACSSLFLERKHS